MKNGNGDSGVNPNIPVEAASKRWSFSFQERRLLFGLLGQTQNGDRIRCRCDVFFLIILRGPRILILQTRV